MLIHYKKSWFILPINLTKNNHIIANPFYQVVRLVKSNLTWLIWLLGFNNNNIDGFVTNGFFGNFMLVILTGQLDHMSFLLLTEMIIRMNNNLIQYTSRA